MGRRRGRAPTRVLLSVRPPAPTTNPYVVLLVRTLPASVDARWFTWRQALCGRVDVFHAHWPEVMLRRDTLVPRIVARLRFLLLLLRLTALRTPVVRTVHNLAAHESGDRVERVLLGWLDRLTTDRIVLNEHTPTPGRGARHLIPHGHYRDWFTGVPPQVTVPGRLLHFGLLRSYKGVEELLAAFTALSDPDLTLHVVGRAVDPRLADAVRDACRHDPRLMATLEHAPDDVLAREVQQAELVVLPYRALHNSGALLLALSLDRPVLVPRTSTTAALAQEVGPEWVLTYESELTGERLGGALLEVRRTGRSTARPDLSARGWPALADQHARVYRGAAARGRTAADS